MIAHSWALDSRLLDAAYFLPVRLLNKSEFDGSDRRKSTLYCATAKLGFHWSEDEEIQILSKQIYGGFRMESTLLILDGLDEADEAGNFMIRRSLVLEPSAVFLSRPTTSMT